MILYIILIVMILLGGCLGINDTQRAKKIYLTFIFSILTLVSSLRAYSVGVDTMQYIKAYTLIKNIPWSEYGTLWYEWGFFALCKVLNYITSDPQILILVSSIFIMSSVGRFIYKNSSNVVISSFLFLTLNLYFNYMNIMRQAIAISIILIGYEYLKENKLIKYSAIVILASLFHQSALCCLVLIIFKKIRYNKIIMIGWGIISSIAFIFWKVFYEISVTFLSKYEGYSQGIFGVSNYFGAIFEFAVNIFILLFGLLVFKISNKGFNRVKLIGDIEYEKKIELLAWIVSSVVFFSIITIRINIFNRITSYFLIFTIVWLAEAIEIIKFKNEKLLYKYAIIFFTFWYCIIILIFRPEWTGVVPYKLFFL